MASTAFRYRLRVYAEDDSTVMTPSAGAPHSEPFQVATHAGISGYRPYLDPPRGRRSRIDLLSRQTDIGRLAFQILDTRVVSGGSNFDRWVTAFLGDGLAGRRMEVEESLNGGSSWSPFFAGRIHEVSLVEGQRLRYLISVYEYAEELKVDVFSRRPHPDVTYADSSSLLPLGPRKPYGGFPAVPGIPGEFHVDTGTLGTFWSILVKDGTLRTNDIYTNVARMNEALKRRFSDVPNVAAAVGGNIVHPSIMVDVKIGGTTKSLRLARVPSGFLTTGGSSTSVVRGTSFFRSTLTDEGVQWIQRIGVAELPAGHPRFMALPSDGTPCEFWIMDDGEPSEDAPIYLDTTRPTTIWKDLLDGKFSVSDEAGDIIRTVPYSAAAFATFDNGAHGVSRFAINDSWKLNEFIEEQICQPFGYAYRFNGLGEVVPLDVAKPTSAGGLITLTNADLDLPAPGWRVGVDGMVGEIRIKYFSDGRDDPVREGKRTVQPTWLYETEHERRILDINEGLGRTEPFTVEAHGVRFSEDGAGGTLFENVFAALLRTFAVRGVVGRIAQLYRLLFSGGLATTSLVCRRTANTSGCFAGDLRIVDIDEIPDPATNRRGGPRVGYCVERSEEGAALRLVFVDMGAVTAAAVPALGAMSLVSGSQKEAVQSALTLNGAGDPAVVWFAVTLTSVGVRPAENSEQWIFGVFEDVPTTIRFFGLPSGSRIWLRARSEPPGGQGSQLPSAWVFPPDSFEDTQGLAAPLDLALGVVTGATAEVLFTPGAVDMATEVWLQTGAGAFALVQTLPAGSSRVVVTGLSVSGSYTVGLQHVDGSGGASSRSTIGVSTGGTAPVAPDPIGISLLVGEAG